MSNVSLASTSARDRRKVLREKLRDLAAPLAIYPLDIKLSQETPVRELRRGSRGFVPDKVAMISLLDVDGVLRWVPGPGVSQAVGRRRAGIPAVRGEVIEQFKFERLEPSQVSAFLAGLDDKINTSRPRLRRWDGTSLVDLPGEKPPEEGKVLVFVHGFISSCQHLIEEFQSTTSGQDFLQRALRHYTAVLTFDHPTISVSPILNAVDLHQRFKDSKAEVHVVCHSRGGLVTRWWLEGFGVNGSRAPRAVFVGSPLAGTGLAAPPRLRSALELLTNIGDFFESATGLAAMAMPFLSVAAGLMKVLTSLTSVAAHTPLVDGVVAMIPGIAGMSRVGNSPELLRMREHQYAAPPDYAAVKANFEPTAPGWAFWRYFRKSQLGHLAAGFVFEGENDLIVDSPSMADLSDQKNIRVLEDFGTSDTVYHTNYFRQSRTLAFLQRQLRIP